MKKTTISIGALLLVLATLTLPSCNNENKETEKSDTTVSSTDTMAVDTMSKVTDTTDTGGRAGQAPPAVKN